MRKRPTPEQVRKKPREAEADLARGLARAPVGRKLAVSEPTGRRWPARYGGLQGDDAQRLRELEAAHVRLKRRAADLRLDKQLLQEAARKDC